MYTDADQLAAAIHALGPITADQRAALKSAAAGTVLADQVTLRFIGPREQPRPWMTVPELAEWLRIDRQTIQRMCREGDFGSGAAFQLSTAAGSAWRVRRSAVQAWMDAQLAQDPA